MATTNNEQENIDIPQQRFEGVVVYTIELNGCLNGIYTNNAPETGQRIYNEIARKNPDGTNDLGLEGTYRCSWIDINNQEHNGTLYIARQPNNFAVRWEEGRNVVFTGTGYLTRSDQFVVVYTRAS